jgi:hypothetical protein
MERYHFGGSWGEAPQKDQKIGSRQLFWRVFLAGFDGNDCARGTVAICLAAVDILRGVANDGGVVADA